MIVNKLRRRLDVSTWDITVVDRDDVHPYQPGYLFLPFGTYSPQQVTRARHKFLPDHVDFVIGEVDVIDPAASTVTLVDGRALAYDYLVIASGTSPRPDPRDARHRVAPQHLRLLHARRLARAGRGAEALRPWTTRRPHRRHAHQ